LRTALGKARAYDLAKRQGLGQEIPSNQPNTFTAEVTMAGGGRPVVRIDASDVRATDVALPETF
jgi:hypothetical protein